MKKIILMFASILLFAVISKAQGLEDETGFKFVKAKYLMETERYEDAIKAFTEIIKEEANYEDALLHRAEAKYALAAYKGVKKDVLEYASYRGLNDKALLLLGKADYKMGNMDAALNTLEIAACGPTNDGQLYEYIGNIYQEKGKLLKACDYWEEGARLGSSKCEMKSRKVCGNTAPKAKPSDKRQDKKEDVLVLGDVKMDGDIATGNDRDETEADVEMKEKVITVNDTKEVEIEPKKEEPVIEQPKDDLPPEDNYVQSVEIDEDLTIDIFQNSLGRRKILDKPSILILSESSGEVAIDVCVNKRGRVISAEYNKELTTIQKKSLISLAVRKAQDFWFEKNEYKEQCGVMLFKITGS